MALMYKIWGNIYIKEWSLKASTLVTMYERWGKIENSHYYLHESHTKCVRPESSIGEAGELIVAPFAYPCPIASHKVMLTDKCTVYSLGDATTHVQSVIRNTLTRKDRSLIMQYTLLQLTILL